MRSQDLAGLVVLAHDRYSPAFYYATGQKIHHGVYLRGTDGSAHLVHDPMERDQAALVGCEASSYAQHGFLQLVKTADSAAKGYGQLIGQLLEQMGIRGRVAFVGDTGAGWAFAMLSHLRAMHPAIEIDATQPDVLALASMTKEESELEKIRHCSRGAVAAMHAARTYLGSLRRRGDHLTDGVHEVVTLGIVRALIHRTFAEHGLAEDGESIVAQGRDAGVPHNRGNDAEPVRTGAAILIDIFPGEAGGGYHTDMTRTYCLGPAPAGLHQLYSDCREVFEAAMAKARAGVLCRDLQEFTCDLFVKQGHATIRENQGLEEGYVHSLGHGVGLAVHEGPRLGGPPENGTLLQPGHVVSIEPGLYYPSRGMGVRIEDLVAVRADGSLENLTPATYDFEIEFAE
ncbi:MAG: Xaa-Pro peptidase family protein [Candidatus Eisenbacteria bacterium]